MTYLLSWKLEESQNSYSQESTQQFGKIVVSVVILDTDNNINLYNKSILNHSHIRGKLYIRNYKKLLLASVSIIKDNVPIVIENIVPVVPVIKIAEERGSGKKLEGLHVSEYIVKMLIYDRVKRMAKEKRTINVNCEEVRVRISMKYKQEVNRNIILENNLEEKILVVDINVLKVGKSFLCKCSQWMEEERRS